MVRAAELNNSRGAIHIDCNTSKHPWCCATQQPLKIDELMIGAGGVIVQIPFLSIKSSKGSIKGKSLLSSKGRY